MIEIQPVVEASGVTKQKIAEGTITPALRRVANLREGVFVVITDLHASDGRGAQQPHGQLLGEFCVEVVGNARSRIVTDVQQGLDFPVDGSVFTGIIDADLHQAQHRPQSKPDQHCQPCLLERQTMGEFYVHWVLHLFPFPYRSQE